MNPKYFPLPKTALASVVFQKEEQQWFYDSLHFHEAYQITLIEQGFGNCFVGNGIHRFEPGDVFVMGRNLPHVFRSDGVYYTDNTLKSEAITIFISPDLVDAFLTKIPEKEEIKSKMAVFEGGLKCRNLKVNQALHQMRNTYGLDSIIAALQLLKIIFDEPDKQLLTDGGLELINKEITFERINTVFDYTSKNYPNEIKLEEIASLISMTPNAFCKYFKQRTRKTYFTFLNDIRVNQACRLLKDTENSISEIAVNCGFFNFSNFQRQFQKRMGISPSNYRNVQLK